MASNGILTDLNQLQSGQQFANSSTAQPAGVASNAQSNSIAKIQAIASGQTFYQINSDLMGRGLSVSNFTSSSSIVNNWSQNYPYRLIVMELLANGTYAYRAEFRLPINPSEMSITSPFAIKTTITSGGVLEEHNGIPTKVITVNASTGFYISKPSNSPSTNLLGQIFSNTISSASTLLQQISTPLTPVFNTNTAATSSGVAGNTAAVNSDLTNTGYFQYHLLRMFLETYVEAKKLPGNQNLRLVFEIAKDRVDYLVTPQSFTTKRSITSPLEYNYVLQFLAWGTVPFGQISNLPADNAISLIASNTSTLQTLFSSLQALRKTVTDFNNLVSAVNTDVNNNILGPINAVIMIVKSALGIPQTVADLPQQLRFDLQSSVIANWNSLVSTINSPQSVTPTASNTGVDPALVSQITDIVGNITNENSGSNAFVGPASGSNGAYVQSLLDNLSLTNSVQITQLPLTSSQQLAIQNATNNALNTNTNQINQLINNLQNLSTSLLPYIENLIATDDTWDLLYSIQDSIANLSAYTADGGTNNSLNSQTNATINSNLSTNALTFWQSTSSNNNIPFTSAQGKFAVPFPFGSTLEDLAFTYLGDSTRWMEIAAINGLQPPYIDQNGFIYDFINNGFQNQFTLSTAENLYIGQTIYISSNTQPSISRTIQRIDEISSTNFIITVDGSANLSSFTVIDSAQILAYLPFTLNSMQQIYIPTNQTSTDFDLQTKPITFLDENVDYIKFTKIDFLLDSNFDLAITSNGFQNLAYGTSNLLQAAKLKMAIPKGSLPLHPNFGAGITPGININDIDLQSLASSISSSFSQDYRFNAPSTINLQIPEPQALTVTVVASVSQNNAILPITFPLVQSNL